MKNRTTIYIDEDLKKQLQMFAFENDVSISKLITDVMCSFINNYTLTQDEYDKGGI